VEKQELVLDSLPNTNSGTCKIRYWSII